MSCLSNLPECFTFNPGSVWTFSTPSGKTFDGLIAPGERRKIAAPRSVCGWDRHWISWGFIRKGRQCHSDTTFGHYWLSGIHCGCFTTAVDNSWNVACFWPILETPARRLASCRVERRRWSSRDNSGLRPHKVYRRAALVDPHCHSGVWVRRLVFDFSGRQETRRNSAESDGERSRALLAGPASPHCSRDRIHFGIA